MVRHQHWRASRKLVLLLVTLAIFTDMLMYDMVLPFLPDHMRQWDISETGIGILFGSYSIATLLSTPLLGSLSDRIGRRLPLLAGIFGLAGAALLYLLADRFLLLLAARLLQGTAGAALWTAGLALLADVFPTEERGRAMGAAMTGMSIGTIVGPPLGGVLFDWSGYHLPFLLAGGLALSVGIALLLLLRDPVRPERRAISILTPLRDIHFLIPAGIVMVGATVLSLLEPTLPLHLGDRLGFGPTSIGLLFASATIAYGLSAPLAGLISDRWGRKWTMIGGMLATLVLLPLVSLPRTWLGEACALIPLGIACAFLLSPTLPELADVADQRGNSTYGLAYALFNTAYALGMMVGPVLSSLLAAQLGFFAALVVTSLCLACYLPALVWTPRPQDSSRSAPQSRAA